MPLFKSMADMGKTVFFIFGFSYMEEAPSTEPRQRSARQLRKPIQVGPPSAVLRARVQYQRGADSEVFECNCLR